MRYQVRMHPSLDILVSSIGEVFVPANGPNKAHWTFGSKSSYGYLIVTINGRKYPVQRLVAQTFIPNPGNKPEVDHLNRNREDNRVSPVCNLRWATHSENQRNTCSNDRVDARGGTHWYENEKQYMREKAARRAAQRRKTHKGVRFSDGKCRYIPTSEALLLLAIPVKERIYTKR